MLNILILISFLFFAYKAFVELPLVSAIIFTFAFLPLCYAYLKIVLSVWLVVLRWVGKYIKSDDPDYRENCKSAIIQFSIYGIFATSMPIIALIVVSKFIIPMMIG